MAAKDMIVTGSMCLAVTMRSVQMVFASMTTCVIGLGFFGAYAGVARRTRAVFSYAGAGSIDFMAFEIA